MDGLPGMQRGLLAGKREAVAPIKKMVGPLAPTRYQYANRYSQAQVLVIALVAMMLGMLLAAYAPLLFGVTRVRDISVLKGLITRVSS